MSDLETKLAELEERKRAREEKAQARILAARVADLELDEKAAEALEAAEAEHGANRVALVRLPQAFCLVKAPHRITYEKYISEPEKMMNAQRQELFVKPCLVGMTWSDFEVIRNQYPAALALAATKCLELAQGERQGLEGK